MNPFYENVELEEAIDLDKELASIGNDAFLIVYNDEINTFEWVIDCFTEILGHSSDQAEQLAYIIHYKGKATVKTATYKTLKPKQEALCDRGLSAVIEGGEESTER
jgi:ATP-dependent Clp protease adaptor protein ClpS